MGLNNQPKIGTISSRVESRTYFNAYRETSGWAGGRSTTVYQCNFFNANYKKKVMHEWWLVINKYGTNTSLIQERIYVSITIDYTIWSRITFQFSLKTDWAMWFALSVLRFIGSNKHIICTHIWRTHPGNYFKFVNFNVNSRLVITFNWYFDIETALWAKLRATSAWPHWPIDQILNQEWRKYRIRMNMPT